jgi:hypothetical protein
MQARALQRSVFRRFFEGLLAGDPVALIAVAVIGGIAALLLLFWWKTARDLRREDEARPPRRQGGQEALRPGPVGHPAPLPAPATNGLRGKMAYQSAGLRRTRRRGRGG